MKVLVTGAGGFVGKAFVKVLRQKKTSIHVLIRDPGKANFFDNETVFIGDLFDRQILSRALCGVEWVIHIPPRVYPKGNFEAQLAAHQRAHLETTRLLCEESFKAGVQKFLYISSVYAGGRSLGEPLGELSKTEPETSYGIAKKEAEELLLKYQKNKLLQVVILRPPSIYGAGSKSMITALLKAAQKNLFLPFKGILTYHSLVFVDNLARAGVELLAKKPEERIESLFIIKDPQDYSLEELYAACCMAFGKEPRLFSLPMGMLKILASVGRLCNKVPLLQQLGILENFIFSRRYCGDRFQKTIPNFHFVSLKNTVNELAR